MRGIKWLSTILLVTLAQIAVSQPIVITDINLIDDKFSSKRFSASFNYSGDLGEHLYFGATALTEDPVNGASYGPSTVSKGTATVEFSVTRPMLIAKDATTSHSIELSFYRAGERASFRTELAQPIEWLSPRSE